MNLHEIRTRKVDDIGARVRVRPNIPDFTRWAGRTGTVLRVATYLIVQLDLEDEDFAEELYMRPDELELV